MEVIFKPIAHDRIRIACLQLLATEFVAIGRFLEVHGGRRPKLFGLYRCMRVGAWKPRANGPTYFDIQTQGRPLRCVLVVLVDMFFVVFGRLTDQTQLQIENTEILFCSK